MFEKVEYCFKCKQDSLFTVLRKDGEVTKYPHCHSCGVYDWRNEELKQEFEGFRYFEKLVRNIVR